MHLTHSNVNHALRRVALLASRDYYSMGNEGPMYFQIEESRNGKVLMMNQMLAVTYAEPWQYVLCNAARDANPFFHFIEAIWMLAGSNEVSPLHYFCSQIGRYSDSPEGMPLYSPDGSADVRTFHGAYGYRWQRHFPDKYLQNMVCNQLMEIIGMLRKDPTTRRAVLQMWDVTADLDTISRDIPCNDMATFQIHNGKLDMHVFNRSNDLIWGMFGSNVVHFSILLEFMAGAIGVPVGRYTQISVNPHIYEHHWDMLGKYATDNTPDVYASESKHKYSHTHPLYGSPAFAVDAKCFLIDCARFIRLLQGHIHGIEKSPTSTLSADCFNSLWSFEGRSGSLMLDNIATTMVDVYRLHKSRRYPEAMDRLKDIRHSYWYEACAMWIDKRHQLHHS